MDAADKFAERIRAASAEEPLRIRGGGSKDFYGHTNDGPRGEILDTRDHAGIVAYEPTELVITARCGTPLAEIEAALAEQGQFLAFEPPSFGGDATIGGVVATGLSGPRRAAVGATRDFVLGVTILDGVSRRLTFGGQVMKNVAGYDVSRLIAGSLGTLGLILEASLKVLPRPVAEATLRFDLPQAKAIEAMNAWAGQPLPISASCWSDDVLSVRLSGARAAVAAARAKLGGETVAEDEAAGFWNDLREQRLDFFAGAEPLWRLSLPSVTAPVDLPGKQLIEWGGSQRWGRGGDAHLVREAATKAGGHATLFRGGGNSVGVFQPLSPVLMHLHRRLKAAFDPRGVLNPGRLYTDI
jgi:glycolate oxidase FAD binding subunit